MITPPQRYKDYLSNLEAKLEKIFSDYESLHKRIEWGHVGYSLYADYLEVANYQINSLKTVLIICKQNRYKDCFILLRSIFETSFIYKLITAGKYYIRFFKKKDEETIEQAIERVNQEIKEHKLKTGDTKILEARRTKIHNERSKVFEVIYEGPYVDGKDIPGNLLPIYQSYFEEFDPESAFLDTNGYLDHMWDFPEREQKQLEYKKNQVDIYRFFLKFEAILYSLRLNGFSDSKIDKKIKAHYNFLSKFVHPTKAGISTINGNHQQAYIDDLNTLNKENYRLSHLTLLYIGYLLCSYIEMVLHVFENTSINYVKKINIPDVKSRLAEFYKIYDYFWFVYNNPHAYDRCQYCMTQIPQDGSSMKAIDDKDIPFNKDILGRLDSLHSGFRNRVCGDYIPPFNLTM